MRKRTTLLTSRQMEILKLRALGKPQKDVALHLGISEQTVKNVCTEIYRILEADCIVSAMNKLGWVRIEE